MWRTFSTCRVHTRVNNNSFTNIYHRRTRNLSQSVKEAAMRTRPVTRWMQVSLATAMLALAAHAATPPISFNAQRVYPVGPDPDSVAMGDFNNDGKPDMAVT